MRITSVIVIAGLCILHCLAAKRAKPGPQNKDSGSIDTKDLMDHVAEECFVFMNKNKKAIEEAAKKGENAYLDFLVNNHCESMAKYMKDKLIG